MTERLADIDARIDGVRQLGAVVNAMRGDSPTLDLSGAVSAGLIEYVQFPDALRGKYQCYTQADLTALRAAGCDHAFDNVQTGVAKYVRQLSAA